MPKRGGPAKLYPLLGIREAQPEQFLEQILTGEKTLEVRVGYRNIRQLKPGTGLLLNAEHPMKIQAGNLG